MKRAKIGYLSCENPVDKRVWSGTHHAVYSCLLQIAEVEILGPYQPRFRFLLGKIFNQLSLKLSGKRFDYRHSFLLSKGYARFFNKKLSAKKFDLIVAPAASCELAFLQTDVPVIYITDGTFKGCLNYHKALTNLSAFNIKEGNTIEKRALQNSRLILVSSQWAADSVKNDYNIEIQKIRILPFGANFGQLPTEAEINFTQPDEWKLLFVGVYWKSKGGDIAFNAFKILADQGHKVSLTILGCFPPENIRHPKLKVIPFIDKNSVEGQEQMKKIYAQHHFLILPTRFDCTPIVINEASAFAVPSLVANSGGVAGHLKGGINGFLIDYNDTGKLYADRIEQFIKDPESYFHLRKSTRLLYEKELNWKRYTEELRLLIFSELPDKTFS